MAKSPTRTGGESPAAGLTVEKASMTDIPALLALINGYAARGIMLPRTEFEMAENLRDFSVVRAEGRVVGCGAVHFYTPATAEVRSLAIDPSFHGRGAGARLMEALEEEGKGFALQSLFAFTYIPEFFRKMGFFEIERGELPLKAWKDCMRCPKFQCCDEIAVIKHLSAESMRVSNTRNVVSSTLSGPGTPSVAELPILR